MRFRDLQFTHVQASGHCLGLAELLKEAGAISAELGDCGVQEERQVGEVCGCWGSLCLWLWGHPHKKLWSP